jgi:hypothetical protein
VEVSLFNLVIRYSVISGTIKKKPSWFPGKVLSYLLNSFHQECADPSRFNSSTRRTLMRIMPRTRVCKLLFISFLFIIKKALLVFEKGPVIVFQPANNPSQLLITRRIITGRIIDRFMFFILFLHFQRSKVKQNP